MVIVITRPRPPQQQPTRHEVTTIALDTMSLSAILRQAADELDAGPTLPPES